MRVQVQAQATSMQHTNSVLELSHARSPRWSQMYRDFWRPLETFRDMGKPQRASAAADRSMSGEHVVLHTLRSFCGQIGSHKARDVTAEPAGLGDMQPFFFPRWVISAGQLRHGPALHAAGCTDWNRGAFAAVHPRASFTRPASKCSWCQGQSAG